MLDGMTNIKASEVLKELKHYTEDLPHYSPDEVAEALEMAIQALEQQPRWIPVSERVAEFPCLACDIFNQIFIPSGIVVLNNHCYEGKDFDFNVEKFLKGKEITSCSGKKYYVKPREITAWMPLPQPYKAESEDTEMIGGGEDEKEA